MRVADRGDIVPAHTLVDYPLMEQDGMRQIGNISGNRRIGIQSPTQVLDVDAGVELVDVVVLVIARLIHRRTTGKHDIRGRHEIDFTLLQMRRRCLEVRRFVYTVDGIRVGVLHRIPDMWDKKGPGDTRVRRHLRDRQTRLAFTIEIHREWRGVLEKQDRVKLREASDEVLWALPDEFPAQMAVDNDPVVRSALGNGRRRLIHLSLPYKFDKIEGRRRFIRSLLLEMITREQVGTRWLSP